MHVRLANLDDVDTMFDIRTSVHENRLGMDDLARLGVTPAWMRAALAGTARGWIAEDDDERAVGFAVADRADGSLFSLFVRPHAEGRGIGRALLEAAEAWLLAGGWSRIWLRTGSDPSFRAHAFYRRAGWEPEAMERVQLRYVKRVPRPDA